MAYSAMQVANAFIRKASEHNISDLTPMKLQKLMFFAQSWYLKRYKQLLIDDNFVRWPYGPVIPSIYYEFANFGANPITKNAIVPNGTIESHLNSIDDVFLNEIFDIYGNFDGWKLSVMTHQPNTAWSMGYIGTVITPVEMYNGVV